MHNQPFVDLQGMLLKLYQQHDYGEAFELANREAGRFPMQIQRMYYWRICLAALMNNTNLALLLLEELIAEGYWLPEDWLRNETDLKSLQGVFAFERLLLICERRHANAQAHSTPQLMTLLPGTLAYRSSTSLPLLLALHGNFRNAGISVDYWRPSVAENWLLALPQSSQVFGPNIYTWDDREWAEREIIAHMESLDGQHRLDHQRSVVGGFSVGGRLAIWLALNDIIPLRRFIAVAPLLYEDELDHLRPMMESCRQRGVRGYIVVGAQDQRCYQGARAFTKMLHEHDIPCTLEIYAHLGHDFPPDFDQSLLRALHVLNREDTN